jgi:hypothetical protein
MASKIWTMYDFRRLQIFHPASFVVSLNTIKLYRKFLSSCTWNDYKQSSDGFLRIWNICLYLIVCFKSLQPRGLFSYLGSESGFNLSLCCSVQLINIHSRQKNSLATQLNFLKVGLPYRLEEDKTREGYKYYCHRENLDHAELHSKWQVLTWPHFKIKISNLQVEQQVALSKQQVAAIVNV